MFYIFSYTKMTADNVEREIRAEANSSRFCVVKIAVFFNIRYRGPADVRLF